MAKAKASTPAGMRRCIGSERFGIEAHDAPAGDFPAQPSQKDGLGRMCTTHWRKYVRALGKAARERKAAETEAMPRADAQAAAETDAQNARRSRRAKGTKTEAAAAEKEVVTS